VAGGSVPANFKKFLLILYCLLKMIQGQTVPELINMSSLDFAKPKIYFLNIRCYAATSTYIHV
jgi:hypothetical protein